MGGGSRGAHLPFAQCSSVPQGTGKGFCGSEAGTTGSSWAESLCCRRGKAHWNTSTETTWVPGAAVGVGGGAVGALVREELVGRGFMGRFWRFHRRCVRWVEHGPAGCPAVQDGLWVPNHSGGAMLSGRPTPPAVLPLALLIPPVMGFSQLWPCVIQLTWILYPWVPSGGGNAVCDTTSRLSGFPLSVPRSEAFILFPRADFMYWKGDTELLPWELPLWLMGRHSAILHHIRGESRCFYDLLVFPGTSNDHLQRGRCLHHSHRSFQLRWSPESSSGRAPTTAAAVVVLDSVAISSSTLRLPALLPHYLWVTELLIAQHPCCLWDLTYLSCFWAEILISLSFAELCRAAERFAMLAESTHWCPSKAPAMLSPGRSVGWASHFR